MTSHIKKRHAFKYRSKTKPSKMNEKLSLVTKAMTMTPFILVFYGALMLFSFSISHGVRFIDLIKTNIFLAFGSVYFIFILFITLIICLTTFINHSLSNFVIKSAIQKSKVMVFKNNPALLISILSLILSCWPSLLLLKNFELAIIGYLVFTISTIAIYHNFATTDFNSDNFINWKRGFSVLFALPPLICLFVASIISGVFSDYIKSFGMTDTNGLIIFHIILFAINFLSFFIPTIEKRRKLPSSMLLISFVCCYIFILPNPTTEYTTNILVKTMGIGLEKRCYLSQDVDKTTIIESLKNKQGKVTELSIVANIENIYYLSKPGDTKMIASIRLISDALTQIGCPDTSKTNHFDFL